MKVKKAVKFCLKENWEVNLVRQIEEELKGFILGRIKESMQAEIAIAI